MNTVRIRLWVSPTTKYSGFKEAVLFSKELKSKAFKTWLTVHYSDTWVAPDKQRSPKNWQGLDIDGLKDSVYQYTK